MTLYCAAIMLAALLIDPLTAPCPHFMPQNARNDAGTESFESDLNMGLDMDMDMGFMTPRADGGAANEQARRGPWASVGITVKVLEAITSDMLSCE